MSDPKFLLWINLESTGTDEKIDPIIEIGYIVTTTTLQPLTDGASMVIRPEMWRRGHYSRCHPGLGRTLSEGGWPEIVFEMHTENGLIADLDDPHRALTMRQAVHRLIGVLEQFGRKHDFMLAGSGVSHFDRRFIAAQMPELEKWLQYPNLDVGVLRRAHGLWAPPGAGYTAANEGKTHRALDDIRCHLAEAEWWYGFLRASHALA